MDNNKQVTILAAIAISLSLFAFAFSYGYAQNVTNQTETETENVATGQPAVPVQTTNGTIVEVAPADSIESLLGTIFTVAIPAITGLAVGIAAILKSFMKDKKSQDGLDTAIAAFKYADTLAAKVNDNYIASGATKTAANLLYEKLTPEQQLQLKEQTDKIPSVDSKIRALAAQVERLRSELPSRTVNRAIADKDPSLGALDRTGK